MRRGLLGVPLAVAVLASLLLLELWTPPQAAMEGATLHQGTPDLLQPFERVARGESRLEKARRTVARRRAEAAVAGGALAALDAPRSASSKKNTSDRSLQQVEGAAGPENSTELREGGAAPAQVGRQAGALQEGVGGAGCDPSEGGGGGGLSIGACFSMWAQLTTAQSELQEAIQLKWQANRLHDEAWFMMDRLDRSRTLTTTLRAWYLNHTQPENATQPQNATSAPAVEIDLQGVLVAARARGIPVSEETQHAWEEWHYIAYHFPAGTGDVVREQLRTAEAEWRQRLDEREVALRSVADMHYRLKGRFAGECIGEGFPPSLLATIYSEDERRVWLSTPGGQQKGATGGSTEEPATGEEEQESDALVGEDGGGQANSTRSEEEGNAAATGAALKGPEGAQPGAAGGGGGTAGAEWRVGKEHWFLQRDLFPGEKNVSFILQYFKHPDNVAPLVAALAGCRAQMPGLTAELLANVDNPEDAPLWMAARNATGDFVVPVFSHNIHEERSYNRLGRMATGAVLVFLQDDQLPPADCSWLGDLLAAYQHYPQLGIAGLNRGVYSSQDTGWRMSALNGDNVYLRSAAAGVDMQFVLEVDLAPMAMRRGVFDTVGGFNEAYSRPGEGAVFLDYELCIRTWLAGYQVAHVAMIPGMQQAGESGTRSGRQLAIRMKNEGMNGVDMSLRMTKFMPAIDEEVLRLNRQLEPVYPDYPRPWEGEPPWQDSSKRPVRLPRFSSNRTESNSL